MFEMLCGFYPYGNDSDDPFESFFNNSNCNNDYASLLRNNEAAIDFPNED